MKRREFIALGCSAGAYVLTAHAQQGEQIRRIGVLMTLAADDPEGQRRPSAFQQKFQELGWTVGRNVQMDYRWPRRHDQTAIRGLGESGDATPYFTGIPHT